MNKLVSKNSVQRFKQGKKINFLQKGSIFLGQGIQKDWRETKGQIDDDSWNSLIELGYNGERNALSAQKYLNSLGLGQQFGQRISEDNAWGNQSRYALNHFLQLKRTQTPQQIISINDYYKPLSEGSVKAVESTLPQTINIQPTVSQPTIAQPTYNRKQVRERIRSLGFNPYSDFSSDDRKTLRKYWNGEISELPDNLHWVNFFLKQGGQLVSKNPVQRFKIRKGQLGLITALFPKKSKNVKKSKDDFGNDVVTTTIENRGKNPFKTQEIISQEVTYNKENPEYNDTVYTYLPQQYISLNPKYETSNNWRTAGVSLRRPQFERLRNIFNNLNGTPKFKNFR